MGSAVLFFCALKESTVQQTQETKKPKHQEHKKQKKTIAHPKEDEKRATDLSSDILKFITAKFLLFLKLFLRPEIRNV